VWRALLATSGYRGHAALERVYLDARLAAAPRATVAALLTSKCAYCDALGTHWCAPVRMRARAPCCCVPADCRRFSFRALGRFTLHACRVCVPCFQAGPRSSRSPGASMADQYPPCSLESFLTRSPPGDGRATPRCAFFSKSLAKALFLLTDAQLKALPALTLTGADAKRTGVAVGADASITLVTSGQCLAAAVERFGSEAALRAEVARRAEKAAAADAAKMEAVRAGVAGAKPPPPRKHTCNFPARLPLRRVAASAAPAPARAEAAARRAQALNQAGGIFTWEPRFGLVPCPPRNSGDDSDDGDERDFEGGEGGEGGFGGGGAADDGFMY
jgi:hypothetical protein